MARVFAACQAVMTDPMATEHDLVEDVQAALGADEAYLLTGIPDLEDGTAGPGPWGPPAPDLTDADTLARLASSLHMSTPTVAGAIGREDPLEILLAGWARGPAPSPPPWASSPERRPPPAWPWRPERGGRGADGAGADRDGLRPPRRPAPDGHRSDPGARGPPGPNPRGSGRGPAHAGPVEDRDPPGAAGAARHPLPGLGRPRGPPDLERRGLRGLHPRRHGPLAPAGPAVGRGRLGRRARTRPVRGIRHGAGGPGQRGQAQREPQRVRPCRGRRGPASGRRGGPGARLHATGGGPGPGRPPPGAGACSGRGSGRRGGRSPSNPSPAGARASWPPCPPWRRKREGAPGRSTMRSS